MSGFWWGGLLGVGAACLCWGAGYRAGHQAAENRYRKQWEKEYVQVQEILAWSAGLSRAELLQRLRAVPQAARGSVSDSL